MSKSNSVAVALIRCRTSVICLVDRVSQLGLGTLTDVSSDDWKDASHWSQQIVSHPYPKRTWNVKLASESPAPVPPPCPLVRSRLSGHKKQSYRSDYTFYGSTIFTRGQKQSWERGLKWGGPQQMNWSSIGPVDQQGKSFFIITPQFVVIAVQQ